MNRILQLPLAVANQIAAGEVIERPASVVKELLENALDAKADNILIEIGYGGLNKIKVSDNGVGIVAEDLPLALTAHATSKIAKLEDLYAINSMGFRGEALASIASVSRVTISSKTADQEYGMKLNNIEQQIIPCPHSEGTTVEVLDLFFNAPVRKKFLKTERFEFQAIDALVRRFALAVPHVAIQLRHNDKLQLQLPAAKEPRSIHSRMNKIFGKLFMEQAISIESNHAGMGLSGFISGTAYQRSQNDKLWIYLNGRMIKDKLLNHAIKQAYEDLLYPGRYPACLLYFTIAPSEVDVNVHPTKHEVRFQQSRLVHDFIVSQLKEALNTNTNEENQDTFSVGTEKYSIRENTQNQYPFSHRVGEGACRADEGLNQLSWYPLNSNYAIIKKNDQPYLIDIQVLQTECLRKRIQSEDLPLTHRPMLVPIKVPYAVSESQIKQLQEIGLKIETQQPLESIGNSTSSPTRHVENAMNCQHTLISLPILTPDLHITAFMQAYFEKSFWDLPELLELLIQNQSINTQSISKEQQAQLTTFLEEYPSSAMRHLSSACCKAIINYENFP
jgi:DNA mismatch repair protein MutL